MQKRRTDKQKDFVLGIDVGGTTIKPRLFEVQDGAIVGEGVGLIDLPTDKGFSKHLEQMQKIFSAAKDRAEGLGGNIIAVGVGMPGRFRNDKILPGTATQLDNGDDHMYEKNIASEYKKILPASLNDISISVRNDADMMLLGAIAAIKKGEAFANDQMGSPIIIDKTIPTGDIGYGSTWEPRVVGLLGLGTGVGNSFIQMDPNGTHKFVTDGHASKLLISVDPKDIDLLAQVETGGVEVVRHTDGRVRAEDLFKDGTFNAIAGIDSAGQYDPENPKHKAAARFAGKYMARTIEAILSEQGEDINLKQGWSFSDRTTLGSRLSGVIISGGLGQGYLQKDGRIDTQRSAPGRDIIEAASTELIQRSHWLGDNGQHTQAARLKQLAIAQFVSNPVAAKSAAEVALADHSQSVAR